MKTIFATVLGAALFLAIHATPSYAVSSTTTTTTTTTMKAEGFKLIHVDDLAQMMKMNPNKVFVFDANNDETRSKEGLIPGAKILSTSSQYDTAQMLPSDKNAKLVFYCANTECTASHAAASRAAKAGYKDVSVMADGISGWKKAGKPVDKFTHS